MNLKHLVAGSKGQLGKEFCRAFNSNGVDFKGVDIDEIDISDKDSVLSLCDSYKPDIIINCAAYNLVDAAENDFDAAFKVNATAVASLADIAEKTGAYLIHFSSDYVFDGAKKNGLYTELDLVNPVNKYGLSKLIGERFALENDRSLILRLSWVFGDGTQNFVCKFLNWIKEKDCLEISFDETSVPTYTGTIVDITLKAAEKRLSGVWHLANSGYASRYEWAKQIVKFLKADKILYPVSKEKFRLPAKRPDFSAMSSRALATELGVVIPEWEEALIIHLKKVL